MKRRPDESFSDYRARRKAANEENKSKLRRGFVVYKNDRTKESGGKPYNKAEESRKIAENAARVILLRYICQFIVNPQQSEAA